MRHPWKAICLIAFVLTAVAPPAHADALARGRAAFARGDYIHAFVLLIPYAQRENAKAQAMVGFMYENGLGAPQSYDAAINFYCRSADHGDPTGQYLLGLLYDKGHGVDRDQVLAYKWLNLAAAGAPSRERENYLKVRNAVASKMSLNQIVAGQRLALIWQPNR